MFVASSSSSCCSMAHPSPVHPLFLPLFLCLVATMQPITNAIMDGVVEDVQLQQQQQRQPLALFAMAQESSEDENGIGSPSSLMPKRHSFDALLRQGRSPRSASAAATMRNALVRFGKRALFPSMAALDDKRNPPQPFVRFGRSAPAADTPTAEQPQLQQHLLSYYFPAAGGGAV